MRRSKLMRMTGVLSAATLGIGAGAAIAAPSDEAPEVETVAEVPGDDEGTEDEELELPDAADEEATSDDDGDGAAEAGDGAETDGGDDADEREGAAHGERVSETARTTDVEGRDEGQEIAEVARSHGEAQRAETDADEGDDAQGDDEAEAGTQSADRSPGAERAAQARGR